MDQVDALLASSLRIEQLLRALPGQVAAALAAQGRGPISPADRETLDVLLPALLAAVGESRWTLRDLDEQAERYDNLRTVLDRLRADGKSAKALGKLFARVAGQDIGGAVIWQRRQERNGALWQIQRLTKPL